jgi:TPR repeat protein
MGSGHIDMLKKASESYNSRAMFMLGAAYMDQTPPNMNAAIKWLTMSAERNNASAQLALGDIYRKGIGTEKDLQKAFRNYTDSSLNGNPAASYHVSMMYKNGIGVEKNLEKYKIFLRMAVEGGNRQGILESENMQ